MLLQDFSLQLKWLLKLQPVVYWRFISTIRSMFLILKCFLTVGRRLLFKRSLVFVWFEYAVLPMDFRYTTGLGAHCACTFRFLPFYSSSSSAINHDPLHPCFSQVFHAQISNQSNFQVKINSISDICNLHLHDEISNFRTQAFRSTDLQCHPVFRLLHVTLRTVGCPIFRPVT